MTLRQDLFEKSELPWESVLDQAAWDSVEWCQVHVTIRVEIVNELDLVDVGEDKVTHGTCLRLREGERSGE